MKKIQAHRVDDHDVSYRDPVLELLEQVNLSPENIVQESCMQPGLFQKAIEYRMGVYWRTQRVELDRKVGEAEVMLRLRREAKESGEKATEGNLKEMALADPDLQKLLRTEIDANEEEEWSKLLLEIFRMRRDCIKVVGQLVGTEQGIRNYFDESNNKLDAARSALEKKYPSSKTR